MELAEKNLNIEKKKEKKMSDDLKKSEKTKRIQSLKKALNLSLKKAIPIVERFDNWQRRNKF